MKKVRDKWNKSKSKMRINSQEMTLPLPKTKFRDMTLSKRF